MQLPLKVSMLVTLLALCDGAVAAPRLWSLSGVQFSDGAVATGSFSYDDVTQTIATWNVRVSDGPSFLGFTYVPGNSLARTMNAPPGLGRTLVFESAAGGGVVQESPGHGERELRLTPLAPLDGRSATVPLKITDAASLECFDCAPFRLIIAGSLSLILLPPPVSIVQVDEFFNAGLQHYFITANAAEKNDLDTGVHPGWARTGQSFKAYVPGSSASGSINPVCRYYSRVSSSHFHSASAAECFAVHILFPVDWIYESDNVFQIDLPDAMTGACPGSTIPVYRLWNNRIDSNHRYTTSPAIKATMVAAGYIAEGYGPDAVIMCAIP